MRSVVPDICRKCSNCESIDAGERSGWSIIRRASVDCRLEPLTLVVGYTSVPDTCPYLLEHTLCEGYIDEVFGETAEESEALK